MREEGKAVREDEKNMRGRGRFEVRSERYKKEEEKL